MPRSEYNLYHSRAVPSYIMAHGEVGQTAPAARTETFASMSVDGLNFGVHPMVDIDDTLHTEHRTTKFSPVTGHGDAFTEMTVNMLRAVIVAQYEELLGSSRTVEDYRLLNNLRRMAADFLCSATEDAKFFNRTFEKILARSAADAPAGFNGIHAATLFDSLEKIVTNVLACGWRKEFGRIQVSLLRHKKQS
ncbi:unnamed protein product [Soboliphyme baturini]|uniref:Uncharacterized protein n=1 Tax=Soboliphyme baturini TaxID=241478 RepID=A0A183J7V2_9BILA|nr:unnamed protein product [Soboliphyme baturini]